MKVAVAGKPGLGGFEMRGGSLARAMGWDVIDVSRIGMLKGRHWDVILLVKYDLGAGEVLRKRCDRFVWDPLDAWMRTECNPVYPYKWWEAHWDRFTFDGIVATSPACAQQMCMGLGDKGVDVYHVPHHSDPRIKSDWYDPDGPMVYAGGKQYVKSGIEAMQRAGLMLDARRVVCCDGNDAWKALKGASLALCPRLYPFNTPINRLCKPQVKIANAVAAGIPVLATDDPCITSLYKVRTGSYEDFYSPQSLVKLMRLALKDSVRDEQPWTFEHYRKAMVEKVLFQPRGK